MQSTIHKAADLAMEERRVVERLLGRSLEEDELVQVRAPVGRILKEAATGEEREAAFERLFARMDRVAERVGDVPQEQLDSELDEAIAEVRRERQAHR